MKKIISVLFTLTVILSCCLFTSAAPEEFSISLPDGFVYAKENGDLTELSRITGVEKDKLEINLRERNAIFFGTNKDNTCQVTLTRTENDFSKSVMSFSVRSYDEIRELAVKMAKDGLSFDGIENVKQGNKYIKLVSKQKDSGGEFTLNEYVTVCSGKLYTLSITSTAGKTDEKTAEDIFKTLKIHDSELPQKNGNRTAYIAISVIGIAVFATVAIYFTYTVVRDLKQKRKAAEITETADDSCAENGTDENPDSESKDTES